MRVNDQKSKGPWRGYNVRTQRNINTIQKVPESTLIDEKNEVSRSKIGSAKKKLRPKPNHFTKTTHSRAFEKKVEKWS